MSCILVNWLSARLTLGVMGFLMFLVTQMIRVNLYIAMVAINSENQGNQTTGNVTFKNNWNENASGLLLGAFYWSYWATELPGGLLAQKFGGRKVLGLGVTIAGIINLLIPAACHTHYLLASFLRALQGLALGVTWPVMHWLSARWIPKTERSKFMTSYHGAAVGTAVTYPISGLIIDYYGWEYVFYFIGVVTLAWCLAWWILVFDSPDKHPRISEKEKEYLDTAIGNVTTNQGDKVKTPWLAILNSKPFWAVLIASQGLMWGTITLSMQMPPYFYQVHHLDIKTTGILSGIPEIGKFFFALIFSTFTDKMIAKNLLSLTTARKLAVAVSEYIPAALLLALAFCGCTEVTLAVVLLALTSSIGGASSSGSLANIVDLSPNHAGTVLGLIKTLTIIPGVVSPLVSTYFTKDTIGEDKCTQWKNVFLFITFVYITCSSVFVIFGSGNVQPWNQKPDTKQEEEMVFLKNKTNMSNKEKEQSSQNV